MYDVIILKKSKKFLSKLNKTDRERIIAGIKRCRIRPYSFVKKLVGNPFFRLRVGNYRVILEIIDNKLLILVVKINHRKKVYK